MYVFACFFSAPRRYRLPALLASMEDLSENQDVGPGEGGPCHPYGYNLSETHHNIVDV